MRLLSTLLFIFLSAACIAQSNEFKRMNPEDFGKQLSSENIQLLDVRTREEYKSGHIAQALQADWNNPQQFAERTLVMQKNKPIYIYCLAGSRSSSAAKWLQERGFTQIIELEGGINAWKKAGKPLEDLVVKNGMSVKNYLDTIAGNKTILVDVGATWCGPCRAMEPVLDSLQKDKKLQFELIKIDADANTEIMNLLDINTIPVFIIYKKGKLIWRQTGMTTTKEITKHLW